MSAAPPLPLPSQIKLSKVNNPVKAKASVWDTGSAPLEAYLTQ